MSGQLRNVKCSFSEIKENIIVRCARQWRRQELKFGGCSPSPPLGAKARLAPPPAVEPGLELGAHILAQHLAPLMRS